MPTCTLSNESGGSPVVLAGRYQPIPTPVPEYDDISSVHQMLSDLSGVGDAVQQTFGWGPGKLSIKLRLIEQSHLDAIQALYFRFVSGARPDVRFSDGTTTWLCSWNCPWKPERLNYSRPLYNLELELLIKSTV